MKTKMPMNARNHQILQSESFSTVIVFKESYTTDCYGVRMHPGIYFILIPLLESPGIILVFNTPLEKGIYPKHFENSGLSRW